LKVYYNENDKKAAAWLRELIPGRMGLLRGYGNAIVPQQAVQFIEAYLGI
jgi:hypothetical protein